MRFDRLRCRHAGAEDLCATLNAHTLLFASLALLVGYQCILFAVFTKQLGVATRLLPTDERWQMWERYMTLERGAIGGLCMFGGGSALLLAAVGLWWQADFGPLDYASTMRLCHSGRDARGARLPNDCGQLLPQHSRHGANMTPVEAIHGRYAPVVGHACWPLIWSICYRRRAACSMLVAAMDKLPSSYCKVART